MSKPTEMQIEAAIAFIRDSMHEPEIDGVLTLLLTKDEQIAIVLHGALHHSPIAVWALLRAAKKLFKDMPHESQVNLAQHCVKHGLAAYALVDDEPPLKGRPN